jgi:hypothetical protein
MMREPVGPDWIAYAAEQREDELDAIGQLIDEAQRLERDPPCSGCSGRGCAYCGGSGLELGEGDG